MSTEIQTAESQAPAKSPDKKSVVTRMADRYGMDPPKFWSMIKKQVFRQQDASDEQLMSVMVVADQYKLNPLTKEIYAFPDKNRGIVPVVGVDGWARIINEHPQFDGMDFQWNPDEESMTCIMYRKDRNHPVKVTEYLEECKRENAQPWKSHPRRMMRHKTMIQAARYAFSLTGIYDEDEAERIVESQRADPAGGNSAADEYREELVSEIEAVLMANNMKQESAWFRDNKDKMLRSNESLEAYRDKLFSKIEAEEEAAAKAKDEQMAEADIIETAENTPDIDDDSMF